MTSEQPSPSPKAVRFEKSAAAQQAQPAQSPPRPQTWRFFGPYKKIWSNSMRTTCAGHAEDFVTIRTPYP